VYAMPPREIVIPSACLNESNKVDNNKVDINESRIPTAAAPTDIPNISEPSNDDNISVVTCWTVTKMDERKKGDCSYHQCTPRKIVDAHFLTVSPNQTDAGRVVKHHLVQTPASHELSAGIRDYKSPSTSSELDHSVVDANDSRDGANNNNQSNFLQSIYNEEQHDGDEDEEEEDEEEEDNEFVSEKICFDAINQSVTAMMLLSSLATSSRDIIGKKVCSNGIDPVYSSSSTRLNLHTQSDNMEDDRKIDNYNKETAPLTMNHHRLSITHNLRWGIMTATLDDE
jgi:hypothetical protein